MNQTPEITLSTSYHICAAHKLWRNDWSESKNKEVFGQCANLHGHEYKLEVEVKGKINKDTGMLINGYDLDNLVKETIFTKLDHKYLNEDIPFFKQNLPTAEWIAFWSYQELKKNLPSCCRLTKIRIYETKELFAEFTE